MRPLRDSEKESYGAVDDVERQKYLQMQKVSIMYTPYSDISEQEEFAGQYRRKICLIYVIILPLVALLAAMVSWLFGNGRVAFIWFCASYLVCFVASFIELFSGMFEPSDFVHGNVFFFVWPIVPFTIGLYAVMKGGPQDVAFGTVLSWLAVFISVANVFALWVSQKAEAERISQWPPLPETEIV